MVDQVEECALFEHKLSECETEVLKLSGLPLEAFERHWAHFEFEGAPFRARYFVFGDSEKPVLLMTHGYASFSLSHFMLFKQLAGRFRVIFFDNCSWGGNTRKLSTSGLESPQKANQLILSWWEAFIASIDHLLPPKFQLFGHSNGGYQAGLYASFHPERILKLFLHSPSGFEGIQPADSYDVY
mmetsp:Transcript_716/g.1013  ORF Transcript_716/g.1013 Transcript_716/m.1013 type:complete len:184 (-) Transcript_716:654-1205(-)